MKEIEHAVAGVSLKKPFTVIAAESAAWGHGELKRCTVNAGPGYALSLRGHDGNLESTFLFPCHMSFSPGHASLAQPLRLLLVHFNLLSHPEAVLDGQLPTPWPSQVHRHHESALVHTVEALRDQWMRCDPGRVMLCQHCDRLEEARITGDVRKIRKRNGRRNRTKVKAIKATRISECRHWPMARSFLQWVARNHGEIIFELTGVLRACPPNPALPGLGPRYVVEPDLMTLMVAHWLVGSHAVQRMVHPRGWSSPRSPLPKFVMPPREKSGMGHALRGAIMLSAQGYGINQDPQSLLYPAPDATVPLPTCPPPQPVRLSPRVVTQDVVAGGVVPCVIPEPASKVEKTTPVLSMGED